MRQVDVVGVRLELPSNQPVLILRDQQVSRYLPLWIGTAEATAISLALEGVDSPRPLTHDLLANVINSLGGQVTSVSVSELVEGTFFATINFLNHDSISARPSDAVALAVRNKVPVFVAQDVMDFAGMDLGIDDDFESDESGLADSEMSQEELEKFRAFLDDIQPDDFS
ncbi:MAG: bifunctional nuclease family protein [Actinobacteria bacterium]|nr:bifunctional nuclease family protein [Actinomycetota bacterium]NBO34735.1 bifunctional nuclease family protein [Actinomycetota bacterium]